MEKPLTSQELAHLRVLHAEIDEHKRKRTMTISDFAKANYQYQKLPRHIGEYGATKDAA